MIVTLSSSRRSLSSTRYMVTLTHRTPKSIWLDTMTHQVGEVTGWGRSVGWCKPIQFVDVTPTLTLTAKGVA